MDKRIIRCNTSNCTVRGGLAFTGNYGLTQLKQHSNGHKRRTLEDQTASIAAVAATSTSMSSTDEANKAWLKEDVHSIKIFDASYPFTNAIFDGSRGQYCMTPGCGTPQIYVVGDHHATQHVRAHHARANLMQHDIQNKSLGSGGNKIMQSFFVRAKVAGAKAELAAAQARAAKENEK